MCTAIQHQMLKRDLTTFRAETIYVAHQPEPGFPTLELRNCRICGSTLVIQAEPEDAPGYLAIEEG